MVSSAAAIIGRIWCLEARGVYLAARVETDTDQPLIVLGILNADRLDADDQAWIDAHHDAVLASVVALSELTVQ